MRSDLRPLHQRGGRYRQPRAHAGRARQEAGRRAARRRRLHGRAARRHARLSGRWARGHARVSRRRRRRGPPLSAAHRVRSRSVPHPRLPASRSSQGRHHGDRCGLSVRARPPALSRAHHARRARAAQGARALVLGRRRARHDRRRHRVDRSPDRRTDSSREPGARLQRARGPYDRRAREEERRRARRGLRVPVRRRLPTARRAEVIAMAATISSASLESLLAGKEPFALIDVREAGEYNSSHIPGSSLIARRQLEYQVSQAVPFKGTPIVVCDDDGRRARLAAATLERLGYRQVSVLDGGINRWVTDGHDTEWGMNVPSKDFGEKVEVVHHVPEVECKDLAARIQKGEKFLILDSRTPEEFRRFCIPGGRSVPGGELALRITDLARNIDQDTTIIVNCAGRTRSIIGARVLQRMGIPRVYGLKNGTAGWVLAGHKLETGADRVDLPQPSAEGVAAAEAYAAKLAAEDGVRYLDIPALKSLMDRRDQATIYFVDVRTSDEYAAGHIPGFRWFPGGQAVQRSDDLAVVKNSQIVFACDGKARATLIASWYRQMGFREVFAVDGGTTAWAASAGALERGMPEETPAGYQEARAKVKAISPRELQASPPATTIFVDTSPDFARGHVPGARWAPRGWLELWIGDIVPSKQASIVVTCADGRGSALAAVTLGELGYQSDSILDGGMNAWQKAGLPVEKGLSGVMAPPTDVVPAGPDRNFADMQNYLRWEEALGHKYAPGRPA